MGSHLGKASGPQQGPGLATLVGAEWRRSSSGIAGAGSTPAGAWAGNRVALGLQHTPERMSRIHGSQQMVQINAHSAQGPFQPSESHGGNPKDDHREVNRKAIAVRKNNSSQVLLKCGGLRRTAGVHGEQNEKARACSWRNASGNFPELQEWGPRTSLRVYLRKSLAMFILLMHVSHQHHGPFLNGRKRKLEAGWRLPQGKPGKLQKMEEEEREGEEMEIREKQDGHV